MSLIPFRDTVRQKSCLQRPDGDAPVQRKLWDHHNMAEEYMSQPNNCGKQEKTIHKEPTLKSEIFPSFHEK